MGRLFLVEVGGKSYRCRLCDNSLVLVDDVLSRSFNCSRGRAFLFRKVVNITVGPQEERRMLSGIHMIEDIFCCCCGQYLGWKYVKVHDQDHKYKEGKFVLERWRIIEEGGDESNTTENNTENNSGSSDAETL